MEGWVCFIIFYRTQGTLSQFRKNAKLICRKLQRAEVQLGYELKLQTKVREDFKITEKAPARAFSWLKVPTIAFTFKTNLREGSFEALFYCELQIKAV